MAETDWLRGTSPAFRLVIATSWLAPESWQKNQEAAICQAIEAGPDWTEYLSLVDRHRTPALSWAALKRVPGLTIPESARKGLQERSDGCRLQAVRHSLIQAGILKAFDCAGIPAITLKGTILSLDLYGDLGLRQSNDLDLVVIPDDIDRAQACLESMGWRLDSTYFPMTPRQMEILRQAEHHLGFVHMERGGVLELHWRNHWDMPDDHASVWARRVVTVWQGYSYQVLNPIDLVLYLCGHGGHHAWFRAKWLGDMARIHTQGRLDWEAVFEHARSTGQERPLLACLKLLNIVHGLPLPDLRGNPWKNLPSFLVKSPLRALKASKDPMAHGNLELLPQPRRLRLFRYGRLALPRRTWREHLSELTYCRDDFRVLRLPDSLIWAYAPLHPILWAWTRLGRIWSRLWRTGSLASPQSQ
jgi:hypothetical protein